MQTKANKPRDGWGGKRAGSGRKPLCSGEKTVMVGLKLTQKQCDLFKELGGADWLRATLDRMQKEKS